MEFSNSILSVSDFLTITLGIIVLFIGRRINQKVNVLREFSIPEPVTGGILISIFLSLVYAFTDITVEFDLHSRDVLLVYFFTTIGINASLRELFAGGKPLVILLSITVVFMIFQNLVGISIARLFGLSPGIGILGGTVSLIGGHGTAIAWAPRVAEAYSIDNAMEIGIACATFGLILASLMGGPIARFLVTRHQLKPARIEAQDVGVADQAGTTPISYMSLLDAVLAIHLAIIIGVLLNQALQEMGLHLPLFVSCLFAGILLTTVQAWGLPRVTGTVWPARTPAIALIADISLGTFLAMSLMSLQLWTLIDLAGPIFTVLAAQFLLAIAINILVVFPAMGRDYDAAVVCSGFGGISLGSTPTAMANMTAVAHRYGASNLAFLVVPLVCAFFIDLVNALLIPYFIANV